MPTILSAHTRARKNLLTLRAPVSFNPAQEEGEEFEEQGRTSQENGPEWSEAQAQHRISQQLLPSVREAAAWGQRGVRIWKRKHWNGLKVPTSKKGLVSQHMSY